MTDRSLFHVQYRRAARRRRRYAEVVERAGVEAQSQRCMGMNHGFLKYLGILEEADAAMAAATAWLRARFAAQRTY